MLPSVVTWQLPRKLDNVVMQKAEEFVAVHEEVACDVGDVEHLTSTDDYDDDAMLLLSEFTTLSLADNDEKSLDGKLQSDSLEECKFNDQLDLRDGVYYKVDKGIVIPTDDQKAYRMQLISTHEKV